MGCDLRSTYYVGNSGWDIFFLSLFLTRPRVRTK